MKNKIKNYIKNLDLKSQLGHILGLSLIISLISLILILPNLLTPFYERNIYEVLNQSLYYIESGTTKTSSNVAFVIKSNNRVFVSKNFTDFFDDDDATAIIKIITKNEGNFNLNGQTYYYANNFKNNERIIALTNNSYIISQRRTLSFIIFPVVAITILIITLILVIWNNRLLNKISKIKEKVDNLDNKNYNHSFKFQVNDELNSLIKSVEDMRNEILSKEEYKTHMYQSLSHELKTPIAVISSYVEAANDKVIPYKDAINTINEEIKTLSKDVNMILELNKLNYLKDNNDHKNDTIDITTLLNDLVKKYMMQRKNIKWSLDIKDENIVRGTYDIWKTIIDNILSNFMVYTDKEIKITIDKEITFYNDGEKIDENLIKDIFKQYKKGMKGNFGLGLSIVKQSLELYNYKITVSNEEKGVLFKIK